MRKFIITSISTIGTIFAIIFAYIAFRRNERLDEKNSAKTEGALLSDIGYIKASIDRMESKLDKQENDYNMLLTRVIKVEEIYNTLSEKLTNHILHSEEK